VRVRACPLCAWSEQSSQYVVDSIRKRHVISEWRVAGGTRAEGVCVAVLGTTEVADMETGKGQSMSFSAPAIDLGGIRPSRLATAGLLTCSLRSATSAEGRPADDDAEVAVVNMVVQVEAADAEPVGKDTPLEALTRTVFDPLS
jgi:hypothetical protein